MGFYRSRQDCKLNLQSNLGYISPVCLVKRVIFHPSKKVMCLLAILYEKEFLMHLYKVSNQSAGSACAETSSYCSISCLVISVYLSLLPVAYLSDAPRRRLVVTGDSARIQDETTESSTWLFNVLTYSTVTRDLGLTSRPKGY